MGDSWVSHDSAGFIDDVVLNDVESVHIEDLGDEIMVIVYCPTEQLDFRIMRHNRKRPVVIRLMDIDRRDSNQEGVAK